MNLILLKSSICSGFLITLAVVYKYMLTKELCIFCYISIIGLITSILNHYLTNQFIKWIDRIAMILSFLYYFFRLNNSELLFMYIGAILFFASKYLGGVKLHCYAHVAISLHNCLAITFNSVAGL